MSVNLSQARSSFESSRMVLPQRAALIPLGFFVCGTVLLLWLVVGEFTGLDFSLLPWMMLVAVMAFSPSFYLYLKRRFVFYHPLVYGAVLGILPGFVIGPIAIMVGMYDTYAYSLIPNPEFYLPLTLVYVAVGFAGLIVGFASPIGRRLGRYWFAKLPRWEWSFEQVKFPALLLIAIGEIGILLALRVGSWGYNMPEEVSEWGFVLVSLGNLGNFAQFVLWFTIFRARCLVPTHWFYILLLLGVGLGNILLAGNKGGLFWYAVFLFTVYLLAGRRLSLPRVMLAGLILGPLVLAAVSYGNTFRTLKGSEQVVDVTDYAGLVFDATHTVVESDWTDILSRGMESLFRRTEITTHLGVIVSNYERLSSLEEQYGVANNIVVYVLTAFIPRFVWQDKPIISNARAIGALYFENPYNSYAITPFGDLLRNFGPLGVPVGMAILGILLAVIYQLVSSQPTTAWRAGLYYVLLTCVSYEGFYGSIFPAMLRAAVVVMAGALFLRFWIGRTRQSPRCLTALDAG
jgi:hypothetical protein